MIIWVHNWPDSHSGGCKTREDLTPEFTVVMISSDVANKSPQIVDTKYLYNSITHLSIWWWDTHETGRFCVTQGRFLAGGNSVLLKFFLVNWLLVLQMPFLKQEGWHAIFSKKLLQKWEVFRADLAFGYWNEHHTGERFAALESSLECRLDLRVEAMILISSSMRLSIKQWIVPRIRALHHPLELFGPWLWPPGRIRNPHAGGVEREVTMRWRKLDKQTPFQCLDSMTWFILPEHNLIEKSLQNF